MKMKNFREFLKGYSKTYDLFGVQGISVVSDIDNNIEKAWNNVGYSIYKAIDNEKKTFKNKLKTSIKTLILKLLHHARYIQVLSLLLRSCKSMPR